jgi:hypothetical protein
MIARRRMIALTAAYAVALQAILSSFGLLAMAGRSAREICGPARNLPGSLPTGPDCMMACPVPCGGAGLAGVAPDDLAVAARPAPSSSVEMRVPVLLRAAQRLLPPPRAPPAA